MAPKEEMSARPSRPRAAPHVRGGGLRAQPARAGGSRRRGATGEVRQGQPGSGRLGPGPLLALPPASSPLARLAGRPAGAGVPLPGRCGRFLGLSERRFKARQTGRRAGRAARRGASWGGRKDTGAARPPAGGSGNPSGRARCAAAAPPPPRP